jgi:hypothetical protein
MKPKRIKPVLPIELVVAGEQAKNFRSEPRFSFRVEWLVGVNNGYGKYWGWRKIHGVTKAYSAGSMEEMLHAIQSSHLAVGQTPGCRHEVSRHAKCFKCGRVIKGNHSNEACLNNRRHQAEWARVMRELKAKYARERKEMEANEADQKTDG